MLHLHLPLSSLISNSNSTAQRLNSFLAIKLRRGSRGSKSTSDWRPPCIMEAVARKIRMPDETSQPKHISRHHPLCQAVATYVPEPATDMREPPSKPTLVSLCSTNHAKLPFCQSRFRLHSGPFEAVVNMGHVEPPQRKGRFSQYAPNKMVELQERFDDLESQGILQPPENLGITLEYLNPSFL